MEFGSNRKMDLQGVVSSAAVARADAADQSSSSSSYTAALTKMSPRRILTAASSSGSDPLASPSNEAMVDLDLQLETNGLSGFSGIAGSMLSSSQRGGVLPTLMTREPSSVEAQLCSLEKHYSHQKELLSRQFEEQQRLLDHEQQMKMQEYIKAAVMQRQDELFEQQQHQQQKLQEEKTKERWEQLKHKRKKEESAVASQAVKLKLRECLLNKSQRELHGISDLPSEFQQHWGNQHSLLEQQHSPPTTTKWSPPLHLLCKYNEEYPLRKTVSEPSLKMRSSKMSLRQKVMQRNSQLVRRRDTYHKRIASTDSSPNSPPTLVSSQDSSVDMGVLEEEPKGYNALDLKLSANGRNGLPDFTIGQPQRDSLSCKAPAISMTTLRGSTAELAVLSSPYGSLPFVYLHSSSSSNVEADAGKLSSCESKSTTTFQPSDDQFEGSGGSDYDAGPGKSPASSCGPPVFPAHLDAADLTAAYVQAMMIARSSLLPRTRSEPIPLPVQLLLQQHQLLFQKQQEQQLLRDETNQLHQKQEMVQRRKLLEMEYDGEEEEEVDVIVIDDSAVGTPDLTSPQFIEDGQATKTRRSFLDKLRTRTISGDKLSSSSSSHCSPPPPPLAIPEKPNLEHGRSCPVDLTGRRVLPLDGSSKRQPITGLVYDPTMLKHVCMCQNNAIHPENPERISSIWSRFEERNLIEKCQLIKSRRAMHEELQTCHSATYVHMYGSSEKHREPSIYETFAQRFCRLPCGGVGVDSDTVWNNVDTTMAARVAAGCVIEMSHKVATGELNNGFAIVRPPGHHAEDSQAMGFCYFNSIAIATKLLLDKIHMKRILIVDWDVHHGNSTQQLFYADPRVLYVSLHRHDNGNFFPGTGSPTEVGIDRGLGFTVNVAWYGGPMGDAEYMAAFRAIVMPIAREYRPELVMVSAGFDAAAGHPKPLGGYNLSPQCFGFMTQQLLMLASGRLVLVLEGGYELKPLCDGAETCLRALLNQQIDLPAESELFRSPCSAAIDTLTITIQQHCAFWPCLRTYIPAINWSYMEAAHYRQSTEETDTVSAFACLSVMPCQSTSSVQERPDSTTTDIAEEQEPMEDS